MRPQAVVFDLDGTLVDSRGDIVRCCLHALARHGFPALPAAEIASYVGDGARALIERATRLAPEDPALAATLATYLAHYAQHGYESTVLMPGATVALDELAHLPLALCTFKPRATLEPLLAHLDLGRRFATVVAAEDVPRHKPDPLPLVVIAERLGVAPATLVMVGDGPQDIEAGRAAGARTVGIPGCFLPRSRLEAARPEALVESLFDLPGLVSRWRTELDA